MFRKEIFAALEGETEAKLSACFYKADDRPFWCLLDIIPIKNELSEVVHHMEGVQETKSSNEPGCAVPGLYKRHHNELHSE